ncbi:LysR substrate-binding domain-containing protein [Burkholderia ubonensis]|uniref:LysR family transcriptional regulator n=1 Tax=Burkholderia ubonensis TaxID=101571 RepID=A0A124RCZ6_9BURK|nr:LysR substrate-binding domain-containing protein [Burkholderia ubonensis]AOJ63201.1 LysR family transcriptional regulator [Burkholderia ubonensis]KVG72410.1 LysR family transcriptional regulator [Burkholderia ubonensis]OMG74633.1 LysR family transcriptional regulator [Burkholderia ubonensis]
MSTPLVRLPSLDLVRGFVAVGRRMSITLAAQDLCVTQSAVSRQVHALEAHLGVALLQRGYRKIAFTPEGERLFRIADAALHSLQDAVGTLTAARERQPVTITASIGVTALWLLPRLGRLQARHPEIDLRVAANDKVLDLRAEGIDLGIRYAPLDRAPEGALHLFDETVVPVAHPAHAARPIADAAALAGHVLLEFDGQPQTQLQWHDHLRAVGLGDARPKSVLRFNQYDQVIQAAIAGQGIALGRLALVAPMLADGRLTVLGPHRPAPQNGYAYWLYQRDPAPRREVAEVRDWIRTEAAECDAAVRAQAAARE